MPITKALITSLLIMMIIFLERLFPFAIFSKRKPGKLIHIFEKYIPPFVMLALLVYSLRDIRFSSFGNWIPQLAAISFTVLTYLWKRNNLISIFGGTIIYMILIRVLG